MKDAATKSYGKKGEKIVAMNHEAIERGMTELQKIEVPDEWKNAVANEKFEVATGERKELVRYVNEILKPIDSYKVNDLPVSAFINHAD